jgi:hypothetical protein
MSSAVLSECGTYRYSLTREWEGGTDLRILWVMLNPSTADAKEDDPTIRKIVKFSKAWGFGSLEVVNLFALRATDPNELTGVTDPVGPENDWHISEALGRKDGLVAAWGASYPIRLSLRPHRVGKMLRADGAKVLGLTRAGDPRHPLYMRDDTLPKWWTS